MKMTMREFKDKSPASRALTFWKVQREPVENLDYHEAVYEAEPCKRDAELPEGYGLWLVYGGAKSYQRARWVA